MIRKYLLWESHAETCSTIVKDKISSGESSYSSHAHAELVKSVFFIQEVCEAFFFQWMSRIDTVRK